MYVLGLTGPTGAGKSLAADRLRERGFAVVDADRVARAAMEPGPCLDAVAAAFGPRVLLPDGRLDRPKLASVVFSDQNALRMLNSVTHPHIIREIRIRLAQLGEGGAGWAALDAPALYESGAQDLCDAVLTVVASPSVRLRRIMRRDGLSREAALRRIDGQPPRGFYTARADFVVDSSRGRVGLLAAVDAVADRILAGEAKRDRRPGGREGPMG